MSQNYSLLGLKHTQQGRYSEALDAYENEYVERLISYGNVNPNHPFMANSYTKIADIELMMGKISHALENYHKSLAIHQSNHKGGNHPLVGEAYTNIAVCYQKQAKYQLALQSLEQALLVLQICYKDKPDHPSIFSVYLLMGDVHREMAEYSLAFEELAIASARYEDRCTNDGERLAMSEIYAKLGQVFMDTRDYEKAILSYQSALDIRLQITPPGFTYHPDAAISHNDIGNAQLKLCNYKEALKSIQESIGLFENIFGEGSNHFYIVDSVISLGKYKYELGDFDDSLNEYHKAHRMLMKTFGEKANHPKIADVFDDLGVVYEAIGDFRHGLSYHHKASNIRDVVYADMNGIHPDIASGMEKISSAFCQQGKYQKAYDIMINANQIYKQVYEVDAEDVLYHPVIARGHRLAADISLLFRRYPEAQSVYVYNRPISKVHAEQLDHEENMLIHVNAGNALRLQCEYEKAFDYYTTSLETCEKTQQHKISHLLFAKISMGLAAVHEDKAEFTEAKAIYAMSYETLKSIYGTRHPIVPRALACIAEIKSKMDLLDEAMRDHLKALEMFRGIYGDDKHPDVGNSFTAIGNMHAQKRQWKDAKDYHTKAICWFKAIYGSESPSGKEIMHPYIANCYNNMGLVYCHEEDYKSAEQYLNRSLKMKRSIYDDTQPHLDFAMSFCSKALYHFMRKEFAKSAELYQQSLDMRKLVYGNGRHLKIAENYDRLGDVYDKMNSESLALESYQLSFRLRVEIVGEVESDHDMAVGCYNIGCMLVKLTKFKEAYPYYNRALAMFKKIFSHDEKNLYLASTYYNMGLVAHNMPGSSRNAIMKYYEKAKDMFEQISPTHEQLENIFENMGHIRFSQCEYQEANDMHRKSLEIRKHHNKEENSEETATCYENIATAVGRLGYYNRARNYYERALFIKKIVFGETAINKDIAKLYNNLGVMWERLEEPEESFKHHINALTMYRAIHGNEKSHPNIASCYSHLGLSFSLQGDVKQGMEYVLDSFGKLEEFYGCDMAKKKGIGWPHFTQFFHHFGRLFYHRRSFNEAIENFQDAIEVMDINDIRHPDMALNHYYIGCAYAEQSRLREALESHYKALEIWETFYDKHPDMADCYREIGVTYQAQAKYSEAMRNFDKSFEIKQYFYGERDKHYIVHCDDMANIYRDLLNFEKSLEYMFKSLHLKKILYPKIHIELLNTLEDIRDIQHLMSNEAQYDHYSDKAKRMKDALDKQAKAK